MPIPEQIFGWSADPYDPQDEEYKFAPAVYAPGTDIKPVVYNITPRVKNQLQEGSCVFHAATEAMEAAEIMNNPPNSAPGWRPSSPITITARWRGTSPWTPGPTSGRP